jgi:Protein of unknown function (DUF3500)
MKKTFFFKTVCGVFAVALLMAFALKKNQSTVTPLTFTAPPPPTDCANPATPIEKVICLCDAFKATLSTTQIAVLQLPYTLTDAQKWSNLPNSLGSVRRVGVQLSGLSATQLAAAKNLLKAVTSTTANEGFAELDAVLAADDYLSVNGGGATYGTGNFFMAFLGTPSMTGKWELQFGGHHYTLSNTYNNGVLVGATPSFRSSEPSGVFTYNGATYQPMLQELAAFAAMLTGLSASEQATAKLSSTFTDLVVGPGKDGQFPAIRVGLKVGDLSSDKKALVLAAVKTYVNDLEETTAATILAKYTAELDNTYIAFSGTTAMTTKNDYVRIDGPSIWLEYSMQGGIVIRTENHPHSVWRDRTSDYGSITNSVKDVAMAKSQFQLGDNFPNPFKETTSIPVSLNHASHVEVNIYDAVGRNMGVFANQDLGEGNHQIMLNRNNNGQHLTTGHYIYQVKIRNKNGLFVQSKSLIIN